MPLHIIRQDITKVKCDAIVNTTNSKMDGRSGVDYAIHTAGGPLLEEECNKMRPLGLGCAKITNAYNLPSKYVIHTSGPVWQGGFMGESIILKSCYIESLKLATKHGCESVAFPLISSGAYGYPKDQVLKFAIEVISEYLYENEMTVYLCVYDKTAYEFSNKLFNDIKDYLNAEESETEEPKGEDLEAAEESKKIESEGIEPIVMISECRSIPKRSCEMKREPSELDRRNSTIYGIDGRLKTLSSYLKDMDKPFIETLFDYIDAKGLTDVECYKRANVDRKTFNKLKNNPKQKPSKQTAVAFAIALKLNFEETQHLLSTAGMTLSRSSVFDKIIRYFIQSGNYNIHEINEALFEFDQVLLGSI